MAGKASPSGAIIQSIKSPGAKGVLLPEEAIAPSTQCQTTLKPAHHFTVA